MIDARSPDGPGPDAWEKDLMAADTCEVDTWSVGVWSVGVCGGVSVGCLSRRSLSTCDEEAMPWDVSADVALDKSPSAASVRALRAFISFWSAC